jgi:hypothetical protein
VTPALGPLFYVKQNEAWTEIGARQISRYKQQQIRESAGEFPLGALPALQQRIDRLRGSGQEHSLRALYRQ